MNDTVTNIERQPAVFSMNRVYRYALWRQWLLGDGQLLVIMLNPSTADEVRNDPTVTRVIDFAADAGFQSLAVANLFGLRSTDPSGLLEHPDPVGKRNDEWIERLIDSSRAVLIAWGAFPAAAKRGATVLRLLETKDVPVYCLGLTKGGAPRHPLYVSRAGGMAEYHETRRESHV